MQTWISAEMQRKGGQGPATVKTESQVLSNLSKAAFTGEYMSRTMEFEQNKLENLISGLKVPSMFRYRWLKTDMSPAMKLGQLGHKFSADRKDFYNQSDAYRELSQNTYPANDEVMKILNRRNEMSNILNKSEFENHLKQRRDAHMPVLFGQSDKFLHETFNQ